MSEKKLFPIFYQQQQAAAEMKPKRTPKKLKKPISLDRNQMLIDAGQKLFGPTLCPECDILYNVGEPEEEARHNKYHKLLHVLKFGGWKYERIVQRYDKDKVIQILPGDSNIWWKKVNVLMDVINKDLGCYETKLNVSHCQVLFYIANRQIAGCLVAEPKNIGHKLIEVNGVDKCSEECYHIKCGIARIWVAADFRKKGIASALIDSLKLHFKPGSILKNEEIALSSPSDLGKQFGFKYFKTRNFMIYLE